MPCLQDGHRGVVNAVRCSGSAQNAGSQLLSLLALQLVSSYFKHEVSYEETAQFCLTKPSVE